MKHYWGKWFADGTELSTGEWQRLALARAFLKKAPIILLDEPTSFMDSWAEASWLAKLRLLIEGQTALIITHRFTTAMQADIIYVMDKGGIVESGSHLELLALNGHYASSWYSQMVSKEQTQKDTIYNDNLKSDQVQKPAFSNSSIQVEGIEDDE